MAYNFFTQGQGPQIDISLFGDASTAGIAAGKNLPTKTTAILQGLTQGISQGMEWLGKMQDIRESEYDIAIKEAQVRNIPKVDKLADLKLKEAELDLKKKEALTDDEIAQQEAELQRKQQFDALRKEALGFASSGDGDLMVQNFSRIAPVLSKQERENYLDGAELTGKLSPENVTMLDKFRTRGRLLGSTDKLQEDADKGYTEALNVVNSSPFISKFRALAGHASNVPASAYSNIYSLHPSGSLETKVKGTGNTTALYAKRDPKGGFKVLPTNEYTASDKYMAVNDETGEIVYDGISEKEYTNFKTIGSHANGSAARRARGELIAADTVSMSRSGKQPDNKTTPAYKNIIKPDLPTDPTISKSQQEINTISNEVLKSTARTYPDSAIAMQVLDSSGLLKGKDLAVIEKSNIPRVLGDYVKDKTDAVVRPGLRNTKDELEKEQNLKELLTRVILSERFKDEEAQKSPAYSQAALDYENKVIYDKLVETEEDYEYRGMPIGYIDLKEARVVYEATKLKSRQDLYIQKNRTTISQDVARYVDSLNAAIRVRLTGATQANVTSAMGKLDIVNSPTPSQ